MPVHTFQRSVRGQAISHYANDDGPNTRLRRSASSTRAHASRRATTRRVPDVLDGTVHTVGGKAHPDFRQTTISQAI